MDLHKQIWVFMVLSRYKSITYSSACNQKGNKKSRKYDTQSSLFYIESDGLKQRCNQFFGFVTSHRKGNVLVSFYIQSFAVFILKKDLPSLWHASLLQGITFCQICKIKFFRLCNWFNTGSVICYQFLSLTISLEKKLPLMKTLSVVTISWDWTH